MRTTTVSIFFLLAFAASPTRAQSPLPPGSADARVAATSSPGPDAIDDVVRAEMQKRQIPGLSLAIIQDGKIVKAKGYGVTEKGGEAPVTASTLFQAGSISKSVAALGALRLVEQGKLALDEDVNAKLITWKVPENEFTREKKVTLRGLLSHTAGLTVHGFPGYATDEPVPTLVQVLDGEKPANTPPIRVDILPGSKWRYSGGGYTVMQQMMIDVTGKPFPQFMQEAVLGPLGMNGRARSSSRCPPRRRSSRRPGTYRDRSLVKGRWHIYPEMAAAGLWTTPSDLARFAIGVQEAVGGQVRQDAVPGRWRGRCSPSRRTRRIGRGPAREREHAAVRPRRARRRVRRPTDRLRGDRPGCRDHDQRQRQLPDGLADPGGHRQGVSLARLPDVHARRIVRRSRSPKTSSPPTRALRVREQPDADLRDGARSPVDPGGRLPGRGVPAGSRRPVLLDPAGRPGHLPQGAATGRSADSSGRRGARSGKCRGSARCSIP